MAMGHREKLKSGDEYDYLTKARRFYFHRPGLIAAIKRRFWKRTRADQRKELAALKGDD